MQRAKGTAWPKCLVIAVAFAALAVLVWLRAAGPLGAEQPAQPAAVLIVAGDQCHLVPASCSGPVPSVPAFLADTPSITVAADLPFQAVATASTGIVAAAFVSVPTPPPRAA
jgi:hypothetical protein